MLEDKKRMKRAGEDRYAVVEPQGVKRKGTAKTMGMFLGLRSSKSFQPSLPGIQLRQSCREPSLLSPLSMLAAWIA